MLRLIRCQPRFQRKVAYVAVGSALILLIYSLSNFGHRLDGSHRHDSSRLDSQMQQQQQRGRDADNGRLKILSAITASRSTLLQGEDRWREPEQESKNSFDVPAVGEDHPDENAIVPVVESQQNNDLAELDMETAPVTPLNQFIKINAESEGHQSPIGLEQFKGPENSQQKTIVGAFLHAWNAYKTYAWGLDELRPLSRTGQQWMGLGLTIVDSLDTIIIMGLKEELTLARGWVAANLNFDYDAEVQLFEVTIRALGGLLSAYHLSGDELFLNKAFELGSKFSPCFGGVTRIPCNRINLRRQQPNFVDISTAEAGSIQLEFRDLSRSANASKFEDEVSAVSDHLHGLQKLDGLVSCFLNPVSGSFQPASSVSVGASADSYYEYLLKQWIQTGKTRDWLKVDYLTAVEGIKKHLLRYSQPSNLAYVGALPSASSVGRVRNEMEHLSCFLPGTLALGVMHGLDKTHLQLAADLMSTCYKMYELMPTRLSPEVAIMNTDSNIHVDITTQYNTRYNLQRPETVESLFYMYRATNNPMYREWGWKIFEAFEKYTRLETGYASIDNVMSPENPGHKDKMETFYLAETLKYLYLLFSDDPHLIDLEKYVMNTEAHPLPVYSR